MNKTNYKNCR